MKLTERLHPATSAQLFSYLCVTSIEVGLVLHFGRDLKFYRVVCENNLKVRHNRNGLQDTASVP